MAIINQLTAVTTNPLASVNAELLFENINDGCSTLVIQVVGPYVGTLILEGCIDGSNNFVTIPVKAHNTGYAQLASMTTQGIYFAQTAGFKKLRVKMTAYTSGSANIFVTASNAIFETHTLLKSSDSHVQVQAGPTATATLTLPAFAGFFHNITHLSIGIYRAAALTGGATPISVTTTNLNGLGFICPTEGAIGTFYDKTIEPCTPIRSAVIGLATTIVMPSITNVTWRAYATYYLSN